MSNVNLLIFQTRRKHFNRHRRQASYKMNLSHCCKQPYLMTSNFNVFFNAVSIYQQNSGLLKTSFCPSALVCLKDTFSVLIRSCLFSQTTILFENRLLPITESYCYDGLTAVSYTHLDVYKRQHLESG